MNSFLVDVKRTLKSGQFLREIKKKTDDIDVCIASMKAAIDGESEWFYRNKVKCDNIYMEKESI